MYHVHEHIENKVKRAAQKDAMQEFKQYRLKRFEMIATFCKI